MSDNEVTVSEVPETEAPTEVEQTEIERWIEDTSLLALGLFEAIFTVVFTEAWKSYEVSEQQAFRNMLDAYLASGAILREKFDGDIWKGHADGTVSLSVTSIRKQREGDTPGKKAKVLTPAEILAKRLGK